jgi:hypothetical protein
LSEPEVDATADPDNDGARDDGDDAGEAQPAETADGRGQTSNEEHPLGRLHAQTGLLQILGQLAGVGASRDQRVDGIGDAVEEVSQRVAGADPLRLPALLTSHVGAEAPGDLVRLGVAPPGDESHPAEQGAGDEDGGENGEDVGHRQALAR